MEINKELYIELLQNELIYERAEHQNTIADLEKEQKYKKLNESDLKRNINEKHQIHQEEKELEKRIEFLEALIFELGDDLDEQKATSKKVIREMKKEAYDIGMVMIRQELENKELKIELVKLKEEDFEEDRKQITEEIAKKLDAEAIS